MDPGGDERLGYYIAGALLILLGWVGGVAANLLAHWMAGSGGMMVGWVRITSTLGSYAWAAFAAGLFTGAVGVVLLSFARASPKGSIVLPGYNYWAGPGAGAARWNLREGGERDPTGLRAVF